MPLDFPASPSLNQTYTEGTRTWRWNGTGWALVPSLVYVSSIIAVPALTIDCGAGNYFTKTVNGNSTFAVSNVPSGGAYSFTLEITHTSGTITWFSGVQWPNNTSPVLNTGFTHVLTFTTINAGTRWRAAALPNYVN